MKKILTLAILLTLSSLLNAQWQPDVRLTNDPAASWTSPNNAWCIASSGSIVHVVWYDTRDGNREIYYKRSTDAGVSWGADTRLTNDTAESYSPSVSVSGSVVHVVWYDNRDGPWRGNLIIPNWEIYYKRSIDGGVSWSADTQLTNNIDWSRCPSVSVFSSAVHVVWQDYRDGNLEIYHKRSTDAGVSWGSDTRLTNNTANSLNSSVTISGTVVHVVWEDDRDGNEEIYYKRSIDGGVSWSADIRLTNNIARSRYPSVSVSGLAVHVVWTDGRDGTAELYYKRTTDGGVSWGPDTRLTNDPAWSDNPSLIVSGSVVHVVWTDSRDGNIEIYYKRSTNAGINWGGDTRLTNNIVNSKYPSVTVSGSVVHVVWNDPRDVNDEIYYKRDPTGNPIGIINIGSGVPSSFSLHQNYPNPFNPVTKIKFDTPPQPSPKGREQWVRLVVYDILGRENAVLVNQQLQPGSYEIEWNASNYPSGVYFYSLITNGFSKTCKMVLIK